MATLSTLSTPIATPLVNPDGTINHIWNEFFVRFMISAGIKVAIDDLETDTADLQTQIDSISTEASASITKSDSDGNASSVLDVLYNGNKTTDGISYTLSGTDKYIQYKFGIEDYFDRIGVWVSNSDGRVYIAYSSDGSSWSYLSGESDHTIDSDGRLVEATSQSNAALNYFQLSAGANLALFPNNVFARYIRLYFTGTYTTEVYEFIASRILIAEMAAIENLAVLSATFGPVSGYAQIVDKPTQLSDINSVEGVKLTSIDDGADVTADQILIYDRYFEQGLKYWAGGVLTVGTIVTNAGKQGGNVIEIVGMISGNTTDYIPVDTTKTYLGRCRVKQTVASTVSNTQNIYFGFTCYDKDLVSLGQHYPIALGESLTTLNSWYTFSGRITGEGTTHDTFIANTVSVKPFFWVNHNSGDGTVQIDMFEFFEDVAASNGIEDGATDNSDLSTGYTTIVGDIISVFSDTITITSGTNDKLDWTENSTTYSSTLTASTSYTPTSLAAHVQTQMRASGDNNTTVTYSSSTNKITIANSTLTILSLLWNSGTNAEDTCAGALGFSKSSDSTGALTYTGNWQAALRVKIGDLS